MTVFADYIDLQTAVLEHVQRPDIADVMPRLVGLAEIHFNRRLRCQEQVRSESLTISEGAADLPYDMLEIIRVYDATGNEFKGRTLQNQGIGYAIADGQILLSPDQDVVMQFYAEIPSLVCGAGGCNWLLHRHPALYLYGVGLEAAKYIRDVEIAQATASLLEMEYKAVHRDDVRKRFPRAVVRVAGVTP